MATSEFSKTKTVENAPLVVKEYMTPGVPPGPAISNLRIFAKKQGHHDGPVHEPPGALGEGEDADRLHIVRSLSESGFVLQSTNSSMSFIPETSKGRASP